LADSLQQIQPLGEKRSMGRFFFELRGEIDEEWIFIDGSYIKAHQHASGARIGEERAIGVSRGGNTSKIHIAADSHGNPIDFEITGGEVHDSQVAGKIIEKVSTSNTKNIVADKGYDSDDIRVQVWAKGAAAIIPRRSNSTKENLGFDSHIYKQRHLVENLFAKLKHYRGIATRFDKLAKNFKSMVFVACSIIWLKIGK
jgi:transposase